MIIRQDSTPQTVCRLDERRMAEAVDPNLYRNRAEDLEAAARSGS